MHWINVGNCFTNVSKLIVDRSNNHMNRFRLLIAHDHKGCTLTSCREIICNHFSPQMSFCRKALRLSNAFNLQMECNEERHPFDFHGTQSKPVIRFNTRISKSAFSNIKTGHTIKLFQIPTGGKLACVAKMRWTTAQKICIKR